MNLKFNLLTIFITLLLVSGCSDENNPVKDQGADEVKIEISTNDDKGESLVFTTSASFKIALQGVESFVYEVKEGEVIEAPDAAVMYANADEEGGSGVITAKDGVNDVTINGLMGNSTYTVFFAFKCGQEYQVKSHVFTTTGYSQTVTLISVDYDGLTFHVEADEDTYYRLGITEAENYYTMKTQFGSTDRSFLEHGTLYKGSQTITIKNGDLIDPELGDEDYNKYSFFYPGGTYIFLLGECDNDGNILCEQNPDYEGGFPGGGLLSRSIEENIAEYTSEYTDGDVIFNGKFARMKFYLKFQEQVENEAKVEILKKTEKSVKFSIIPGKEVINYGVALLSEDDYNLMKEWVGEKGIHTCVFNKSEQLSGNQEITYENFSVGMKFKLFIISNYDESYTKQSLYVYDFEITESTAPKCELLLTEVDSNDPYSVTFNIKAPNKDCAGIRYLAEYKENWVGAPYPDAEMLQIYGQDDFSKKVVDGINSAEGYDVKFDSREKSTTRIIMLSYNKDEAASDVIYECEATSAEEQDKEPVSQELLDKITGTWNLTYKYRTWKGGETETKTFPIVFSNIAEEAPASMPSDLVKSLKEYWTTQGKTDAQAQVLIDEYFQDYKESVTRATNKYKGQNRIVGNGFDVLHSFYSPWDLFCNVNYVAATTDELFYDYGPKIFLEAGKNSDGTESVIMNTYQNAIPPVSAIDYYEYWILGDNVESQAAGYFNVAYPVEISQDGKTMTIKGMLDETLSPYPFYPSVAYLMGGFPMYKMYADGAITLTKVSEEEELDVLKPVASRLGMFGEFKHAPFVRNGRFMRTYIPNEKTATRFEKTIMEYSPIDWTSKIEHKWK